MSAHQVSAIQGEHMQGVACLVVAREDDVALRRKTDIRTILTPRIRDSYYCVTEKTG